MGIPEHYSRDIAQRCQVLIRHVRPVIEAGLPDDQEFGGPLGTTFLLAMATPMSVLPIERIFKPARPEAVVAGDAADIARRPDVDSGDLSKIVALVEAEHCAAA